MRNGLLIFLRGMAMGIAEVIPGVSGGTIAFITGIYEKLLLTIKTVLGPGVFIAYREGGFREVWQKANGTFLLFLLLGMGTGLVSGVFGVSRLMESYPQLLWAFFFGLILASVIYIGRQVGQWRIAEILALVLASALAFYITVATPSNGLEALWFVLLSGMIAISALMLPGISGSFILLLMGMYSFIISSVRSLLENQDTGSLKVVLTFAVGCLLGMAFFSRLLTWTFRHYYRPTMAALTGFMLGSLNRIWPWRNVLAYRENSRGERVPLLERSVLPGDYEGEPMIWGVLLLVLAGITLVWFMDRASRKKPDNAK